MRRSDKIALMLFCAPLLLGLSVGGWRIARWLHWATHPTPQNRQPRPMFHEWRDHDWGPGWGMMYYHTDDSGTWAIADTTLNILVLVATGDPSGRRGFSDLRPECAVLWEDTPYEVTVEGTSNVLIWVGREERHDLDLAPGAAAATQGALVQLEIASGQQDGLLDVALQSYRGRDEERLRRLVADYRESLRESGD